MLYGIRISCFCVFACRHVFLLAWFAFIFCGECIFGFLFFLVWLLFFSVFVIQFKFSNIRFRLLVDMKVRNWVIRKFRPLINGGSKLMILNYSSSRTTSPLNIQPWERCSRCSFPWNHSQLLWVLSWEFLRRSVKCLVAQLKVLQKKGGQYSAWYSNAGPFAG